MLLCTASLTLLYACTTELACCVPVCLVCFCLAVVCSVSSVYGLLSACCAVAGSVWAVRSGAGGGAPYVGRLNECDSIFHIMNDIARRGVYTR